MHHLGRSLLVGLLWLTCTALPAAAAETPIAVENLPPIPAVPPSNKPAKPIAESPAAAVPSAPIEVALPVTHTPVIAAGATEVIGAPLPMDLKRYQFLPLFTKGADATTMPLLWPLLTSQPLAASHALIQRAVIVVHDDQRAVGEALQRLQRLAGSTTTGDQARTMLVVPLFPVIADRATFQPLLTDATPHVAVWDAEAWWQGGATSLADNAQRAISSMSALDLLLLALADKQKYPTLQEIIIAGYGRGGDLVQRYALYGRAPEILATQKLTLRYVVAAAQSYVYLTDLRPGATAGSFATPKDTKICPEYQDYPYGLEQPNEYARQTAGNMARMAYVARDVTYLVSDSDSIPATDQQCGAAWQGKSVKERAVNYDAFLKNAFGDANKHRLLLMPSMGENPLTLLTSGCGASLLFADGECLRAK